LKFLGDIFLLFEVEFRSLLADVSFSSVPSFCREAITQQHSATTQKICFAFACLIALFLCIVYLRIRDGFIIFPVLLGLHVEELN
jgi:hypothetical protein